MIGRGKGICIVCHLIPSAKRMQPHISQPTFRNPLLSVLRVILVTAVHLIKYPAFLYHIHRPTCFFFSVLYYRQLTHRY